jgi:hypothetical protein
MQRPATRSPFRHAPLVEGPGDDALEQILREILVPDSHLEEAKRRRQVVCNLAMEHPAARAYWFSGSLAHGTENAPLGDADCGVMIDRRDPEFRAFGPDAGPDGRGPEAFVQSFAAFIEPRLAEVGYGDARIDLSGNRAIKVEFHDPVDLDELGVVDPFVDLIIGLDRREAPGVWIPNRRRNGWDPAHPQRHTELMTQQGPQPLIVHRAHVIRLEKRAVKREEARRGEGIICSWNLSALALDHVDERQPLATAVAASLNDAAQSIRAGLTDDPAGVAGPIPLPDGATCTGTAERLAAMGAVVEQAAAAGSLAEARRLLSALFGVEVDAIRARERNAVRRAPLGDALRRRDGAGVAGALGATVPIKPTRSHGGSR